MVNICTCTLIFWFPKKHMYIMAMLLTLPKWYFTTRICNYCCHLEHVLQLKVSIHNSLLLNILYLCKCHTAACRFLSQNEVTATVKMSFISTQFANTLVLRVKFYNTKTVTHRQHNLTQRLPLVQNDAEIFQI